MASTTNNAVTTNASVKTDDSVAANNSVAELSAPAVARDLSRASGWRAALRRHGVSSLVYLLATWLTSAPYMGDTNFYAVVAARVLGGAPYQNWEATGNYSLWEFGHLVWRPLAVVLFPVFRPLARQFVGTDLTAQVTVELLALNLLSGLACVLLLRGLLARVCRRAWAADAAVAGFVFTQAFLNYGQTGCSYVPGLALLLAGTWLAVRAGEAVRVEETDARGGADAERGGAADARGGASDGRGRALSLGLSVAAAAALAGSAGLWFPYVWAVPGAVCAPLLLVGADRARLRVTVTTSLAFAVLNTLLFLGVAAGIGVHSVADFKAWVESSSHGLGRNGGVPQLVFGFARAFVNMGNDNVLFKRYLLGDVYAPVSPLELVRASLWKLAYFYLFLAALFVGLLRARARRDVLAFLAVTALPVLAFALLWQGTVMERYLALCPAVFLALGRVLDDARVWRWLKAALLGFCAVMIAVNFAAMRTGAQERRHEASAARVRELRPRLTPQSIVLVGKDELENFVRDFPLDPVNFRNDLRVYSFLPIGMPQLPRWRRDVAERARAAWSAGGEVWVSRRVFAERPQAHWDWVEGADARVSWAELPAFFRAFETGETVGGEDGFVRLERTPRNERLVNGVAEGGAAK